MNKEVCIKSEAHLEYEKLRCTPHLRGFDKLAGGWFMVCVVVGLEENIQKKVEGLHKAGLMHGNIRFANLLVKDDTEDFMLVDFDWAGKVGKVTYPLNVDRALNLWCM